MRKGKIAGKIFGIALVFVMIGVVLGALLGAALPSGGFACQSQTLAQDGKTWHVDDDGAECPTADFTKIQDAVDAATAGDTIIVYPGFYAENVDVNKDHLTIVAATKANTVVDAKKWNDHTFEVISDYVNISGFIIQGGTASSGIYLDNVMHCNILDNRVRNNQYGIRLSYSSNNTLSGNTAISNDLAGIHLSYSSNNTFSGNTAYENKEWATGISLSSSSNNTLNDNRMWDNYYNFGVYGSELSDLINDIDTSNKVNGKPIRYLIDKQDLVIDSTWDVGYLGIVNCTNILVKDLTLTNNSQGVLLAYSTDSRVENVSAFSNYQGIALSDSPHNTLSGNFANSNRYVGIHLADSHYNTLSGNFANSNWAYGIQLGKSRYNTLSDNTANSNWAHGIFLKDSSHNTLSDNTADSNESFGIFLKDFRSHDNTLSGNTVSNNDVGIELRHSSSNTLSRNTASNNEYGIVFLESGNNNLIYCNSFMNNTDRNVYPEYTTNTWNSPEEIPYTYKGNAYTNYLGNYWDDYEGADTDNDGIGDAPYSIDSDNDNYPLVEPFENYEITENQPPDEPSNLFPANGASGVDTNADLSWTGGDPDAGDTVTYDVYFDTTGATTLVSNNQSATTYDPGTLSYNTTYYWKIVARDNHGVTKEGPVWNFTTKRNPWLYDEDDSGYIEIGELLQAINDYIAGDITISQLLEIINLYISHTRK